MATFLKSRAGAAQLGVTLMITAFVVVAGFMFWLSVTAKPTVIVAPEPKDVFANEISLLDFSSGPAGYEGQEVSLTDVPISGRFGNFGHWINLLDANRNGFILFLSESLRADTTVATGTVEEGMLVTLSGMVMPRTDSVLDAWEAAGAFAQPLDRMLAGSTRYPYFLEVIRLRLPETSGPGQGDGAGSG